MDYSKVLAALNARWIKELLMELPTSRFWGLWLLLALIFAVPAILHAIAPSGLLH